MSWPCLWLINLFSFFQPHCDLRYWIWYLFDSSTTKAFLHELMMQEQTAGMNTSEHNCSLSLGNCAGQQSFQIISPCEGFCLLVHTGTLTLCKWTYLQLVCNKYDSPFPGRTVNGVVEEMGSHMSVQGTEGIIEQQDGSVTVKRPGKTHSLPLTPTQIGSSFPNLNTQCISGGFTYSRSFFIYHGL